MMAKKKAKKKAKAPAHAENTRINAAKRRGEQELHCYTYDDLVKLTGMARNTIYRHVSRGTLDPDNIESALYWLARHGSPEIKRNLLDYALEPGKSKNPAARK